MHEAMLHHPNGPICFGGEHMSYLTGWRRVAVLSAREVICAIAAAATAQSH